MGHPVTTNPFIIMLINMTVVFVVLISLSFLIRLIHMIDPTKQPEPQGGEDEEAAETAAIVSKLKESPAPAPIPAPAVEEGISAEVIAAISAAVACCGIAGQVRAVRVVHNQNSTWRSSSALASLTKE